MDYCNTHASPYADCARTCRGTGNNGCVLVCSATVCLKRILI
ncbi:hypothetical protein BRUCa_2800 [Brucella melitensis]|nr:hypothetical protein BM28_B0629 [Brucella melitensis M28]